MRQLILKAPEPARPEIEKAIAKHEARNTIELSSSDGVAFLTYLPNRSVNNFLNSLSDIDGLQVSLHSSGAIPLYPPAEKAPEQAVDVEPKSSLEIFMEGIQSVGSWFGLVGYAVAAGIIVWIGLYTSTIHLLVAAMLVAPFAGPAMNAALASSAGEMSLLKNSVLRYLVAILTGVLVSLLLTFCFPLQSLTPLMEHISQISMMAVLLPLTAGFAGAINICQSERDSLVSGAAVGILVAASLAPPVGLLGISLYLWDVNVLVSNLFVIALQLLGIHLSATLVFYYYGKIDYKGVRFVKGRKWLRQIALVVVFAGLCLMLWGQFSEPPFLRKASRKTELNDAVEQVLTGMDKLQVVSHSAEFTGRMKNDKAILRYEIEVIPAGEGISGEDLRSMVLAKLKAGLRRKHDDIYPVYQVSVLKD